MNQAQRKNFITINEEFNCENCNQKNPLLKGSCRNHCVFCLYSKHVDEEVPGDRKSNCFGLMEPVELDQNAEKGYVIIHKCTKCGKKSRNKVAFDDNFDTVIKLSKFKQV
jgi:hypothetical protein